MNARQIEKELKQQINGVDAELKRVQKLQTAACFGSAVGLGLVLSSMNEHLILLLGISALGILVNLTATIFLSKKHLS